MSINVTVDGLNQDIEVTIGANIAPITTNFSEAIVVADVPTYDGAYTFTPTKETQTVSIANKKATADITINPIPNNYGLITWNGSTLTVS